MSSFHSNTPAKNSYLQTSGFSKRNVSAGNRGEKMLVDRLSKALSRQIERGDASILRGVTVSYVKAGARMKADADVVVVFGRKLILLDAKYWAGGHYRRRWYVFGEVGRVTSGKWQKLKFEWSETSALAPVGAQIVDHLGKHGLRVEIVGCYTVMCNPKSSVARNLRNSTRGTQWTSMDKALKKVRRCTARSANKKLTSEVVQKLQRLCQ